MAEVQDGAHAASAQRVDQPARPVEVEAEPAGVLGFDPDRHAALRGELGRVPQLVGDELDIGGQIVERGVPLGAARQHDGRGADLHGEIQQLREVLIPRTPALGIQRRVQSAHVGVDRAHAQAGAAQGRGDLVHRLRGQLVGDVIAHSGQRSEVDAPESEIGDLAERGLEGEPAEADGGTDDALVKRQLCLLVDGDVRAREVDSEDSTGRTVGLSTVARSALSRFNTQMTTTASSLPSLHTQNLREQALVALREAIVMGSLSPGSHLAEVRLANDLGISRGTLREALRQLQQEGLAVTDGRGRLHVRSLDPRTIRDTFRVRAALESLAARTIAELPAPAKNSALTALEKALEVMAAAEDESLHVRLEADVEFHRTLCRASGNEQLLKTWEQIAGVVRMSIMYAGAERAQRNVAVARHREVTELLRENPRDLEARMTAHILDVLDDFELELED